MAKGEAAIGIPVPNSGWHTDVPINLLPPDALADGLNCLVYRDGILRPRRGYEPLQFQTGNDGRVMGAIAWSEVGNQMFVIATPTQWWLLQSDGWVNITDPANPQEGDEPNVPARFAQFGFYQGQQVIYGVNGSSHSPMRWWYLTDPVGPYQTMIDVKNNNFTFAAADVAVVQNRLVAIAVAESGIVNPRRVRWSAVNDATGTKTDANGSWPPSAFNDLEGDAGNLICIQTSSRTTAVIYAQNGAWIMSATASAGLGESEAFTFDRLNGAYAAPWSPAAITNIGGVHYYLATDRHIWRCDGQSAQPISGVIDAGLLRIVDTGEDQAPVALYDATQFRLWFFFEQVETDEDTQHDELEEPVSAVSYDLLTGAWSVPQQFPDYITMAIPVIEQMGPTWDNPGTDATGQTYTWETAPWANWNAIPETQQPAIYVGLQTGIVCRFGTAITDSGKPIVYRAAWGLRTPPDPRDMFNVDTVEIYLEPLTVPEPVELTVDGLQTPYDNAPVTLLDRQVPQNDIRQWLMETDPLPLVPAGSFKNVLFTQVLIAGTSITGGPSFAGIFLYANVLRRADLGVRSANG